MTSANTSLTPAAAASGGSRTWIGRLAHRAPLHRAGAVFAWLSIILSLLAPVAVESPLPWQVRFFAMLLFVCLAPGSAVIAYVRLGNRAAAVSLAIALSLCVTATAAVTMVWTGTWNPYAGLIGVASVTLVAGLLAIVPRARPSAADRVTRGPGTPPPTGAAGVPGIVSSSGALPLVSPAGPTLAGAGMPPLTGAGIDPTVALRRTSGPAAVVTPATALTEPVAPGDLERERLLREIRASAFTADAEPAPSPPVYTPNGLPPPVTSSASGAPPRITTSPTPGTVTPALNTPAINTPGINTPAINIPGVIAADASPPSPAPGTPAPSADVTSVIPGPRANLADRTELIPAARAVADSQAASPTAPILTVPTPPITSAVAARTSTSAAATPGTTGAGANTAVTSSTGANTAITGSTGANTTVAGPAVAAAPAAGDDATPTTILALDPDEVERIRARKVAALLAERSVLTVRVDDTVLIPAVAGLPAAAPAVTRPRRSLGAWLRSRSARNVGLHAVIIAVTVVLWLFSMLHSSTTNIGDYGLLSVMNPTFYVACLLCTLGFMIQLTRKPFNPVVLVGYVVVLLLIMHATVPAMVTEPEYAWTYRHVGVIEYIRSLGTATNPQDIYQQWPTFFSLVAQISSLSGGHTIALAKWAPVFFDALDCLPLFAIVRVLSTDRRVAYLTAFVFTATNWVAQDYLSPQAFAFFLCLCVLLVMLRWFRKAPNPARRVWPRLLGRIQKAMQEGLNPAYGDIVDAPYTSKTARRLAMTVLYFIYAVIVASHQLSPYLIAICTVALVVLGLVRPVWLAPILLGISVSYLVPRYQIADSYGLFNGFNFLSNASGNGGSIATAGQLFSSHVVRVLALGMWAATALTVFLARKRLAQVSVAATLAFAPFCLLVAQNYGGEAIYRVFLFSSPWCAYLVSRQALSLGESAARVVRRGLQGAQSIVRELPYLRVARIAAGAPLLCAMVLASMQGEHGQLTFDQFTPNEVAAAQYLYQHAPIGSVLMFAEGNFPQELTAQYGEANDGKLTEMTLLPSGSLPGVLTLSAAMDQDDMDKLTGYFSADLGDGPKFLIISDSMVHFAHYFGYLSDGVLQRLNAGVAASPAWSLWYHGSGVAIYRFAS